MDAEVVAGLDVVVAVGAEGNGVPIRRPLAGPGSIQSARAGVVRFGGAPPIPVHPAAPAPEGAEPGQVLGVVFALRLNPRRRRANPARGWAFGAERGSSEHGGLDLRR